MPDMPSWSTIPRHRRPEDAPRVELAEWVRLISRRVEQQLRRDWLLGFTMGNVLFRSLLSMSPTVYSGTRLKRDDGIYGCQQQGNKKSLLAIRHGLPWTRLVIRGHDGLGMNYDKSWHPLFQLQRMERKDRHCQLVS